MGGTRKIKDDDIARYGGMTGEWRSKLASLTPKQRKQAEKIIHVNIFTDETCDVSDSAVREILQYYRIKRYEKIPEIIADD
jgi:hypothetical protein